MTTELERRLRALAAGDDMTTTRRAVLLAAATVVSSIEVEREILARLDADLAPLLAGEDTDPTR